MKNPHIREGVVVRPVNNPKHLTFKLVGESYMLRKNPTEKH
jgi:hypothetical protein